MKKSVLLFFSVIFMMTGAGIASAQGKYGADSAECIKYLSYYNEYYKQKNYDDALPNWRKAYSLCPPTANQTMLINGTSLYRRLINENRNNPVYFEALVDTLLTLHDIRAEYYPKYAVTALNNKGLDMINYVKDDPERLYKEFNEIISVNKAEVKPQILLFQLNTACELYKNGTVLAEDVINNYNTSKRSRPKTGPFFYAFCCTVRVLTCPRTRPASRRSSGRSHSRTGPFRGSWCKARTCSRSRGGTERRGRRSCPDARPLQ